MEKKAKSEDGMAWLEKYLHPPSRASAGIAGIPDRATNNSAVVDWKNETVIGAPPNVTTTWSCLIVGVNNPFVNAVIYRWIGPPPTLSGGYFPTVSINNNFNWGTNSVNWKQAVAQFRPAAASITTYLDVSDLYNQGMVTVAQSSLSSLPGTQSGVNPVLLVNTYDADVLPVDPGQVMQTSPRNYHGKAKEGTFSVHSFSNPSIPYEPLDPIPAQLIGVINGAPIRIDLVTGQSLNGISQPTTSIPPIYLGMQSSYTLYTGLLPQATIVLKSCQTWEILVPPASIWSPFVTAGAMPDDLALESAAIARFHMPDAMPAAANDLGGIWQGLQKFMPALAKVWKFTKVPAQAAISAVPGGGVINTLINGLEGLMSDPNFSSKSKKKKSSNQSSTVRNSVPITPTSSVRRRRPKKKMTTKF